MNNKSLFKSIIVTTTLLLSSKAFAHFPTLSCETRDQDKTKLYCLAGYSDASLAGEVELEVYSYDEELLFKVNTASDGSASMKMPEGEFYIVFNPGHESPAEFDYAEL